MNNIVIQNIIRFVGLMLLQVLVLNNIYLGQFINPYLYVLFVLMLPTNLMPVWTLLIAFASGLCVDMFSNVLGLHTAACTLVAFCRIVFADKILTRGDDIIIDTPSIYSVAPQQFAFYIFLLLLIYNIAYYMLEAFTFNGWWRLFISALLSTGVVWCLAMLCQLLFMHRKNAK